MIFCLKLRTRVGQWKVRTVVDPGKLWEVEELMNTCFSALWNKMTGFNKIKQPIWVIHLYILKEQIKIVDIERKNRFSTNIWKVLCTHKNSNWWRRTHTVDAVHGHCYHFLQVLTQSVQVHLWLAAYCDHPFSYGYHFCTC